MTKQGSKVKNLQFLRRNNRASVIKQLVLGNANSRIELSNQLGLSKMAISEIVNGLIEKGFVEESTNLADDCGQKKTGRNPVLLKIRDKSINAIGVYIIRYELHCVISDICGNIFYHDFQKLPENADNKDFHKILHLLIEKSIEESKGMYVAGIGIATIGPVDIYHRRLLNPPAFYHINNINFEHELQQYTDLPVVVDNDMNASALAEYYYDPEHKGKPLVYVGLSSGVGAGVIYKGTIYHGGAGFAGEVGHISINPRGDKCCCGQRGCIELYTSVLNLLKNTGTRSVEELTELMNREVVPRYVSAGIDDCRTAIQALLVALANMYDPEVIILGEIPDELKPVYLDGMEEYTNKHMLQHGYRKVKVESSTMGKRTSYLGGPSLVFKQIFNGEIELPSGI